MCTYSRKLARKVLGFTLIELMIVVAIISVLAAIAIPSYSKHVLRGKRAEARASLLNEATILERYYSNNNRYTMAPNVFPNGLPSKYTETGNYRITIASTPPYQAFTLTAIPDFSDPECGNFTLTNVGRKDIVAGTGTVSKCWKR